MAIDEQALAASIANLTSAFGDFADPPVQAASAHLAGVVAAAGELLSADSVGILLLDENGALRAAASTSPAAGQLERAQQRLGLGPGHDCLARRGTVLVEDLSAEPAYARLAAELAPLRVGGVLSAPIWVADEVVGNLNLMCDEAHRWTEPETRAAAAYAQVVGELLGASAQSGKARAGQPFPAGSSGATETGGGTHAG